jgi:hypothetical protein
MKSGTFPGHVCTVVEKRFVVTIKMPAHPEDAKTNLYPQNINGRRFRKWMEELKGVVRSYEYQCDDDCFFEFVVDAQTCKQSKKEFEDMVKAALDEAGYQW